MTAVNDLSHLPDDRFEAWLAGVEARPAVNPDDDAREDAQRGDLDAPPPAAEPPQDDTSGLVCTCPETDPLVRAGAYTVRGPEIEPHAVTCLRWGSTSPAGPAAGAVDEEGLTEAGWCPVTASSAPSLRDKLVAALPEHQAWCYAVAHSDCCGPGICDCGVSDSLARILPLVEAEVAARVTQALEEAAADWRAYDTGPAPKDVPMYLRERAARNGGQQT